MKASDPRCRTAGRHTGSELPIGAAHRRFPPRPLPIGQHLPETNLEPVAPEMSCAELVAMALLLSGRSRPERPASRRGPRNGPERKIHCRVTARRSFSPAQPMSPRSIWSPRARMSRSCSPLTSRFSIHRKSVPPRQQARRPAVLQPQSPLDPVFRIPPVRSCTEVRYPIGRRRAPRRAVAKENPVRTPLTIGAAIPHSGMRAPLLNMRVN